MCSRAGLYLCPATDRSNITGTKLRKSGFRIHFTAVSGSKFCGVPGRRSLGRETFGASPPLIGAGNLKFLRVPLSLSLGRETQTPLCYVRVAVIALRLLFVFRSLCAVFGTGLLSVGYAGSIKSTSDDVVSGTRKVLYTAATDQNNRVLLKVVALTRDIACYFDTVGKTNSGDLSKSGVRLLRGCSLNSCTNASLLRSGNVCCFLLKGVVSFLKSRSCGLLCCGLPSFSY